MYQFDGTNGQHYHGDDDGDQAGYHIHAADVNNDGAYDLLIGAPGGDPKSDTDAGEGFVIFGTRENRPIGDSNGDGVFVVIDNGSAQRS